MSGTVRRALVAASCGLLAVAFAPARVVHACGQYSCLPVVAGVSPLQVVLDGRPVHLTLLGDNLSTVNAVIVSPLAAPQGWVARDDRTLLVTLPPTIAPGIYSVRVVSPDGASDPSMAPQFQVFPAPPPTQAPTPKPRPTPAPAPTPTPPLPQTGTLALTATPPPPSPGAPLGVVTGGGTQISPAPAPIVVVVGLALGGSVYLLWGHPRRLDGRWRSEPLRHLVGRPAQALHVGSVCVYCGRLHFILLTRHDLWRMRRYCGPRCATSAGAMPPPPGDARASRAAPPRAARRGGC